jgi:hypothetical protein
VPKEDVPSHRQVPMGRHDGWGVVGRFKLEQCIVSWSDFRGWLGIHLARFASRVRTDGLVSSRSASFPTQRAVASEEEARR